MNVEPNDPDATPKVIAFHLPQYHPIPENDEWWGTGFTEWTNVSRARPVFRGHYQPHRPADLGFYDLRLPEVRAQQAALARAAGIDAFAYYHYWFNGRRLLERPVDEIVASKAPDFPFMVVWANENWTRRWDGGENHLLMKQVYSPEDDLEHIRSLKATLTDPRYLRRDGKPMIAIYRSSLLPDSKRTTDIWREEVRRWGLPGLYLLRIESFRTETGDPRPLGFDAAVQFQPSWETIPEVSARIRLRRRFARFHPRFSHRIVSYPKLVEQTTSRGVPPYPKWPGVTPGFDNSARRKVEATILRGTSPALYQRWLHSALRMSTKTAATHESHDRGLVFVNAWNEWAEGNHLEPDQRFGHGYLTATKAAITQFEAERSLVERDGP